MTRDLIPPPADVEAVGKIVVDCAFHVHDILGPGLLESTYEHCLAHELTGRGKSVQRQFLLPITFKDIQIDAAY